VNVNIVSVQRTASLTPGRIGKQDLLVTYQVEGQGSDFVVVPDADADEKAIQEAVRAKIAAQHKAIGTTFEV
jgi:hypothetical protein